MSISAKTGVGREVIVNQRYDEASLSRASIATEGPAVFNLRLLALSPGRGSTLFSFLTEHGSRTNGHVSYSSSPALRNLASSVFGDTPNFSDARVLFHLHSRKVLSRSTRSIWPTARPVTSSKLPSQLNCSGSIPPGKLVVSGFVAGSCSPSAVMLSPS